MAKTLKEKNQMECNKKARAKYNAAHYKSVLVKFKNSEAEVLNKFCLDNNVSKNSVIRNSVMTYIENFNKNN